MKEVFFDLAWHTPGAIPVHFLAVLGFQIGGPIYTGHAVSCSYHFVSHYIYQLLQLSETYDSYEI